MQEDATSQERTQNTPRSYGRTVDMPQSYIRRGQRTQLNPCQERTVNTPQSWSGEDTYQLQERPHLDPVGEKHLDP
jgi:hypothetical protein